MKNTNTTPKQNEVIDTYVNLSERTVIEFLRLSKEAIEANPENGQRLRYIALAYYNAALLLVGKFDLTCIMQANNISSETFENLF